MSDKEIFQILNLPALVEALGNSNPTIQINVFNIQNNVSQQSTIDLTIVDSLQISPEQKKETKGFLESVCGSIKTISETGNAVSEVAKYCTSLGAAGPALFQHFMAWISGLPL